MPAGEWRIVAQAEAAQIRNRFPEVVQLNLRYRAGQAITRHGSQHLGTFTVRSRDLDSARTTAKEVERAIGFRLEPVTP